MSIRSCRRLSVLFCCTAFLLPTLGADWPQFRGPNGNAGTDDAMTPIKWSDSENIAWKQPLPGRGASSPVVSGHRIFLTAFTGFGMDEQEPGDKTDLRLHTICLDRNTGEIVWDQAIEASPDTQDFNRRVADHGYASSTPVTDGNAVYSFFGVSGVVAYDCEGALLWQANVGTKSAGFGSAASPVLFENLLIVNASIESGTLFAFDKRTGTEVWRVEGINRAWTTPCIAEAPGGEYELVINHKDTIRAINPHTGEQLWECVGIDDYVVPAPISHEGVVYCLGGRKNRCIAVKLGGRGDVTETHKLWEVNIGANVTSPVYYDGHLYWASDKGIANCLDTKTGKDLYRERLPSRGRIYASIVRGGDKLYVTTRDAGILVLRARPKYEELAVNVIDTGQDLINASPAINRNQLLLRTDSFLYCIGTQGAE